MLAPHEPSESTRARFRGCKLNSIVQRVWAILEEKGVDYKYVEVNPYHKQPEFLALNPRGLVPTVEYDHKPLYESTVISEFLEEAYPDHRPRLLPENAFDRAISRIWIDFVTFVASSPRSFLVQ